MPKLKPFFTYFGGKYRAAPKYPAPTHDMVIEPFAGAAGYSVRHFQKRVILLDRNPVIVELWRYLVGATASDIHSLPLDVTDIAGMDLPQGAKYLIGFG